MQNKRRILVIVPLILLTIAAAFLAGRMLNQNIDLHGFTGFGGRNGAAGVTINLIPAKELPTAPPEIIGLFTERADNIILLQTTSLKTGGQGVVVHKSESGDIAPSANMSYGPKVEVLLTKETAMYRETTEPVDPTAGNNLTVQQTVEEATPNDLTTQSFITVWGRKSGDRIIAEAVLIDTPAIPQQP